MAKVTDEYVRTEFYKRFAHMSPDRQEGIIEALQATMAVMQARDAETPPLLEVDEASPNA